MSTNFTLKGASAPMQKQSQQKKKKRSGKKQSQPKQNKKKVTQRKVVIRDPALRGAIQQREQFYLSPCAKSYLKALTDPFAMQAGIACIPDNTDVPSFKPLVIARGSFAVGSAGVGYVLCSPTVGVNDATAFHFTTTAFTGGSFSAIPTTGVSTSNWPQIPFATSQVSTTGVLHRTVGCGLRIRYLGTELNRSGRLIPYRSNAVGGTSPLGVSATIALARPEVPSDPCDRRWHCISYLPTSAFLTNRNDDCYSYNNNANSIQNSNVQFGDLGFIVDGANPNNTFEWEAFCHKEYTSANGSVVPQGMTPSHSDAVGLSAVRDSLEGVQPSGDASRYFQDALNYMKQWSPTDISHVGAYVTAGRATAQALGWH